MQGIKVCVVLVFLIVTCHVWGFFLRCSGVDMAMATTSDRVPLRAGGPWEEPASPRGRWGGCWILFALLETREKSSPVPR